MLSAIPCFMDQPAQHPASSILPAPCTGCMGNMPLDTLASGQGQIPAPPAKCIHIAGSDSPCSALLSRIQVIFRGPAAPLDPQPPQLLVPTGLMGRKCSAQSMPVGGLVPLWKKVPLGTAAGLGPGRSLAGCTHPPCIPGSCTSQMYPGAGIIPTGGSCKKNRATPPPEKKTTKPNKHHKAPKPIFFPT